MFKNKTLFILLPVLIAVGVGSFAISEKYFENNSKLDNEYKKPYLSKSFQNEKQSETENQKNDETLEAAVIPKILPTTKFVYEYYYLKDDIIKKEEGLPMSFLINSTFNDLKEMYPEWNILSFSEKEVIMRKLVNEESEEHYIIGQKDGYITIFYEEEKDGTDIYEITNICTDGLCEQEKRLLNDGIYVTGEKNLSKILEDYNS